MSDAMRNMSKKYQQSQLIDLSLPFSEKNPRIFRTKAMPHAIFQQFSNNFATHYLSTNYTENAYHSTTPLTAKGYE